jgi:WD40 repeat protein
MCANHCLAYSPDGKTVAAGDMAGSLCLWDVASRTSLYLDDPAWFGKFDDDYPNSITFSPDGKSLVGVYDEWICVWDVASGRNTANFGLNRRPLFLSITPFLDRLGRNSPWEQPIYVRYTPAGKLMALQVHGSTAKLWEVTGLPVTLFGILTGLGAGLVFLAAVACFPSTYRRASNAPTSADPAWLRSGAVARIRLQPLFSPANILLQLIRLAVVLFLVILALVGMRGR